MEQSCSYVLAIFALFYSLLIRSTKKQSIRTCQTKQVLFLTSLLKWKSFFNKQFLRKIIDIKCPANCAAVLWIHFAIRISIPLKPTNKNHQPKLVTGNGNLTTSWLCFYMNTNINDFSYQIHLSATLIILI